MAYIFDNDRPIYIQLVEKLELEIVSGKLKPGERIASVRELALTTKVNPNTMQKALAELESKGLVFTERTNGKFVTTDTKLIEIKKLELANIKINTFISDMKNIGVELDDAIKYLHKFKEK